MKRKSGLVKQLTKGAALAAGSMLLTKVITGSLSRYRLRDKVVLITGGSRGLGLVLARQLADEGARVVICGRSEETLQRASQDLASRTPDHLAIPCDVTDKEQVRNMIQQIKDEIGEIDVLVNNAGQIQVGPMEAMTEADYESALEVHLWGPLNLLQAVLPDMKKRRRGRIVNIVSIGGKVSFPHLLPYNTSKFAFSGFSEGITAELRRHNIKVTTVYPGLMRTGSPRNIDVKGRHKKEYAWFKTLDSLPGISMDADQAARQIIEALRQGRRTVTLSLPARIATTLHGLAPELTISMFSLFNKLLPKAGNGQQSQKGYESDSRLSTSFLTKKTDKAAVQNLEQ